MGRRPDLNRLSLLPAGEPPVPPAVADNGPALVEWRRVVPILTAADLLAKTDVATLASYCTTYSRWLRAEREVAGLTSLIVEGPRGPALHPLARLSRDLGADLRSLAMALGLNAAARHRLRASTAEKMSDDVAEFLQ